MSRFVFALATALSVVGSPSVGTAAEEALRAGESAHAEDEPVDVGAQRLSGRVVDADGRTPVGGGIVLLRPPGSPIEYAHPEMPMWRPQPLAAAFADAGGRFEFNVEPGVYAVHVLQNAWIHASVDRVVVTKTAEQPEVVVQLPRTVQLEGSLSGGPSANVYGLEVHVQPIEIEPLGFMLVDGLGCSNVIREDGSFTVEYIPSGAARIYLRDGDAAHTRNCRVKRAVIATVELEQSVQREEFDASESWPGTLELRLAGHDTLWINGNPPGSSTFFARVTSEGDPCGFRIELSADGKMLLRGMPPDLYRVALSSRKERWTESLGSPFRVLPGEYVELDLDLGPRAGRIRFIDHATEAPLAQTLVRLRVGTIPSRSGVYRTDDDGWLEVALPPGDYTVAQPSEERFGDVSRGRLLWVVGGASEITVRMKAF